MKREYTYTATVIIEDGDVYDHWAETDDGRAIGIGPDMLADAMSRFRAAKQGAAEEAADMALEARKERQA